MNPVEKLFAVLAAVYPLSDELKERLIQLITVRKFKKGDILLRPGEVANHVYFISEGLLRAFYVDMGNKEYTVWIMKELDVMLSVFSFFFRQPGDQYIEALEDCELVFIDYDGLEAIYKEFMEFNIVGRVLTQKYYALSDERAMILRMKNIDRYGYMMEKYPDLLNRVFQKYMASYLGMTEGTFSRIKKDWKYRNS